MSGIAGWLLTLAGPLALRAMAALGFSVVTFTGVTSSVAALVALAQDNWSALPVAVLQLASLSGIPEFLGMVMAAYTTRMTIWVAVNSTRFIVK